MRCSFIMLGGLLLLLMSPIALADEVQTHPTTAPAEKAILKHRFPPGRCVVTETMDLREDISVDKQQLPTRRIRQTVVSTREVSKARPDRSREIAISFRTIKQRMQIGETEIAFDSEGAHEQQDQNLRRIVQAIRQCSISARIDADGNVLEVKGTDELWEHLTHQVHFPAPMLKQLRIALVDNLMNRIVRDPGKLLPSRPSGVGDEWKVTTRLPAPFAGRFTRKYTCVLKEIRRGGSERTALIEFNGTSRAEKGFSLEIPPHKLRIHKMHFKQAGQMLINVQTGTILHRSEKQTGEIEMSVSTPDGQSDSIIFAQDMTTECTVRLQDESQGDPGPEGTPRS